MAITIKQIEIFIAIVKFANVTRAANSLKLSQSAVSMALSELEKQLGEMLFDRSGKRLILNTSGKLLLPKATELISRIEEIKKVFNKDQEEVSGLLKLGASKTIGNYKLPDIVSQFIQQNSGVKISINIKNTQEIITDILNFTSDLGIIEGICVRKELKTIHWKKDKMVIIASANHPLALKKTVQIKDLESQNWILRETGSSPRTVFETACSGIIEKINIILELGNTEAIKNTVKSGIGLGCVSETTINNELNHKEIVVIKTPYLNLNRDFHIVMHQKKYETLLIKKFIEFCSVM